MPGIGWVGDTAIGVASVLTSALADEIATGTVSEATWQQAAAALVSAGTGWIPAVGWIPSTLADIAGLYISANSTVGQYHRTEDAFAQFFQLF